jgi:hypothetical protein
MAYGVQINTAFGDNTTETLRSMRLVGISNVSYNNVALYVAGQGGWTSSNGLVLVQPTSGQNIETIPNYTLNSNGITFDAKPTYYFGNFASSIRIHWLRYR